MKKFKQLIQNIRKCYLSTKNMNYVLQIDAKRIAAFCIVIYVTLLSNCYTDWKINVLMPRTF